MINPEIKRIAIGGAIGAGLAAIYLHAPHAHAEPFNDPNHQHDMAVMCTELAENPTVAGINALIASWQRQEGTSKAAAQMGTQTLLDAVSYDCPQYKMLILNWASTLPPAIPATPGQPTNPPYNANTPNNINTIPGLPGTRQETVA